LWLYGKENVPERRAEGFASLAIVQPQNGTGMGHQEMLRDLRNCHSREDASAFHRSWHAWASRARLPAVYKVAKMVKSHLHNILTYYTHGITNAVSEGLNSAIQTIKKRGRIATSRTSRPRSTSTAVVSNSTRRSQLGIEDPCDSRKNRVFLVPETKGKTLEQIEAHMRSGKRSRAL
jgi:hypothetical protein